jgi:putative chitinase
MVLMTLSQVQHLAPNAQPNYAQAFASADQVLAPYGINANALRLAHFMAQILHETGGLTILIESLNYSAPRLVQVWPNRFKTIAAATPYAHNPEKLANFVYGGRMGNTQPGDGWRFIGRGLLQITGRDSYARYGQALGIDLVGSPDLAFAATSCLQIAAEEWTAAGSNAFADADSLRKVTRAINGGYVGLASRQEWLTKAKQVWPSG